VLLTLPIREILPATPRARIVRIALEGRRFPYRPGQAVMVAPHGRPPARPYSLAAAPEEAVRDDQLELLMGVDASGRPGLPLALEAGVLVDLEGPMGRFTLPDDPEEPCLVFIAGGTGIAPLRAMLRHALRTPRRQIGLLYSARAPGEFAYEEELQQLARAGRIELRQTVTRDLGSTDWTGRRGRIGRQDLAPLVHTPATLCFICGPPALVREMPTILDELGVPAHRIRQEEWA
jgi:NAD(P)H-flavin reductase